MHRAQWLGASPTLLFNRLAASRYGVLVWLALYGAAWTAIPYFSNASYPTDVVEELGWAREWPIFTYRHPPMMVWLLEIAYQATGRWTGSPYLLSALVFGVAQFCLYVLVRDVRDRTTAFAAVVVASLIPYFGVHLPQWNANVAQYAFAGLLLLAAWRALNGGSGLWWLLAGAAAAGGTLAKFTFVMIPLAIAIVAVADPWFRARLRWGWLIAAIALCAVLLAPTIWATYTMSGAMTGYVTGRMAAGGSVLFTHIEGIAIVLGSTIAILVLPAVEVRFGLEKQRAEQSLESRKLERLLGFAVFLPLVGVAVGAVIAGVFIKDHWLLAYFLLLPPWLVLRMTRHTAGPLAFRLGGQVTALVAVLCLMLVYPLEREMRYATAHGARLSWPPLMPAETLTAEALSVWKEGLRARCLPETTPVTVIGGNTPAALVASDLPERPQWFEDFTPAFAPWVKPETLRAHGMLAISDQTPTFAEDYGLDPAAKRTYEWANSRGGLGQRLEIAAYLPPSSCP